MTNKIYKKETGGISQHVWYGGDIGENVQWQNESNFDWKQDKAGRRKSTIVSGLEWA